MSSSGWVDFSSNRASDKNGAIKKADVSSTVVAWAAAAAADDAPCPLPTPPFACGAGAAAAAVAAAFLLRVVLVVGVGGAVAGGVGVAAWFAAAGAGVVVVPVALVAKSSRSWTVKQPAMSISLGIEMLVVTTTRLQSTITTLAREPVPIRHATVVFARDRVPPNLVQLCVLRTAPSGPARSAAASISSTRAVTRSANVVVGANASVNAFMFLLASSPPAWLLRCCAQLFERMAIVV